MFRHGDRVEKGPQGQTLIDAQPPADSARALLTHAHIIDAEYLATALVFARAERSCFREPASAMVYLEQANILLVYPLHAE